MADQDTRPLTDEERAELEELRAEKARRERAELEELRAERASAAAGPRTEAAPAADAAPAPSTPAAPAPDPAPPAPAESKASAPEAPAAAPAPAPAPAADGPRTFGQRMVLSEGEDDDGIPTMPPAQKAIIAVCIVLAVCAIAYVALSNGGVFS